MEYNCNPLGVGLPLVATGNRMSWVATWIVAIVVIPWIFCSVLVRKSCGCNVVCNC